MRANILKVFTMFVGMLLILAPATAFAQQSISFFDDEDGSICYWSEDSMRQVAYYNLIRSSRTISSVSNLSEATLSSQNSTLPVSAAYAPDDHYYKTGIPGSWDQPYYDMWGWRTIGMESLPDSQKGSGIIVAVLDSGIDSAQAQVGGELEGRLTDSSTWRNFTVDPDHPTSDVPDNFGHGTHVTGIIAANANHIGIIGVSPEVTILPLKVLDDTGNGTPEALIAAIIYAADNNAKIINMSFTVVISKMTQKEIDDLTNAIDYAYSMGCILIASSGNDAGPDNGLLPAISDKVLTVAATDPDNYVAGFSNWGKVDVAAPGVDILSLRAAGTDMYHTLYPDPDNPPYYHYGDNFIRTYVPPPPDNGALYYRASGTSMSAAYVSGLAALLYAKYAGLLFGDVIMNIIRLAATDFGPIGWDSDYGYGLIDAYSALTSNIEYYGPLQVIINSTDDIYANFGAPYGLYQITSDEDFSVLNSAKPTFFKIDNANNIVSYFDFGSDNPSTGLWRRSNATGQWEYLNVSLEPLSIEFEGNNDIVVDFGSTWGLFEYSDVSGWNQLNSVEPALFKTDNADDIAAYFNGYGLCVYTRGDWSLLNSLAPGSMEFDSNNNLIAALGSRGLYKYTIARWWSEFNTSGPPAAPEVIEMEGPNDTVANFIGYGLYRYYAGNWNQLNNADPKFFTVGRFYDIVAYFDFGISNPTTGLYRYKNETGKWVYLNQTLEPVSSTIAFDSNDTIIADFGPDWGLWEYEYSGDTNWHQLHGTEPTFFKIDNANNIVAYFDFGSSNPTTGLYKYRNTTGMWESLNQSLKPVLPIEFDGDNDIIADFGPTLGLWEYSDASGWQPLNTPEPTFLQMDNTNNIIGYFDFGSSNPATGLYKYSDGSGWTSLHQTLKPLSMEFDSNNNMIADFGSAWGLWEYSDESGWHLVNNADPTFFKINNANNIVGYFDFGSSNPTTGLYIYKNTIGWEYLHQGLKPVWMDFDYYDNILCYFGTTWGFYSYGEVTWSQLNAANPSFVKIDNADNIVTYFDGYGLYRYIHESHWWADLHQTLKPVSVEFDSSNNIIADFGPEWGLWEYSGGPDWNLLHSTEPTFFKIDHADDIVAYFDFGSSNPTTGLYKYSSVSGWKYLYQTVKPLSIDFDSNNNIIADFGLSYGLYKYEIASNSWNKLNAVSPYANNLTTQVESKTLLAPDLAGNMYYHYLDETWNGQESGRPDIIKRQDPDAYGDLAFKYTYSTRTDIPPSSVPVNEKAYSDSDMKSLNHIYTTYDNADHRQESMTFMDNIGPDGNPVMVSYTRYDKDIVSNGSTYNPPEEAIFASPNMYSDVYYHMMAEDFYDPWGTPSDPTDDSGRIGFAIHSTAQNNSQGQSTIYGLSAIYSYYPDTTGRIYLEYLYSDKFWTNFVDTLIYTYKTDIPDEIDTVTVDSTEWDPSHYSSDQNEYDQKATIRYNMQDPSHVTTTSGGGFTFTNAMAGEKPNTNPFNGQPL